MTAQHSPFVLVDGSSYLFRAYHALPPLTNTQGEPTGAIYGVINMIRRLLKDYSPTHIAVVFDDKGKTFRSDIYKEYKANRPPMPDELACQIQPIHDIIRAMGLPVIVTPGVEADDVIGTLADAACAAGYETVISTGDKDLAQLVNDKVTLINTMTSETLDIDGVTAKFGLPPERIVDYLTLMGDKVDNVPGIPKVGPKTAVKWLTEYGTLEGVIEHANDIKGKVGENLREHLDMLPTSKSLVTIQREVPLSVQVEDLVVQSADNALLADWFTRFEFKNWLSEVQSDGQAAPENNAEPVEYQCILTKKEFNDWLNTISKTQLLCFDTETTSLNYMQAELVGLSFATPETEAVYIPVAHDYEGAPDQCDRNWVLEQLKPLLQNPDIKKLGQNLKYDMSVLARYDIDVQGVAFDTMLESYVTNASATRHDMDSLALKYLGKETIHFEDIAGKGKQQKTFNEIALEEATPYAAEDADVTLALHNKLWPDLEKDAALKTIFNQIEMPLVPVLSKMERTGVLIDRKMLENQSQHLAKRLSELEADAFEQAGSEFNLASPKQLQEILFEKMGLPVLKKTPKGQASTSEEVLQELALSFDLPKLILEYRSLSKLKSTYTDKLPEQIDTNTGRVHTSYHQAVTATGRLSSSDPNLQNIPIRTEEGRHIRKAFIAPEDHLILAADYSQIELRIMAHLSKDKSLLSAFEQGLDIHSATAAEIFSVDLEAVTPDQRRSAKAINFGLIYGMSAFGLAKQIGVDRASAQGYIDVYFSRYPGVHNYMESTREQVRETGHVETLFGRRLYLPEIHSSNKMRQMAAERAAINAPMQGTAADIIKRAMISVHQWIIDESIPARMIMQVHDELVFEVTQSEAKAIAEQVADKMAQAADLSVPLIASTGIGINWDEAH